MSQSRKKKHFKHKPTIETFHKDLITNIKKNHELDALLRIGSCPEIVNRLSSDSKKETLLMVAAERDSVAVIDLLLNKKAELNLQDAKGFTALMRASICLNLPMVEKLIAHGADPNPQEGYTAVDLATLTLNGHLSNQTISDYKHTPFSTWLPVVSALSYAKGMIRHASLSEGIVVRLMSSDQTNYQVYCVTRHFIAQSKDGVLTENFINHWKNYYKIVKLSAKVTDDILDEGTGKNIPTEIRSLVSDYDLPSIVERIVFFNQNKTPVTHEEIASMASSDHSSKIAKLKLC